MSSITLHNGPKATHRTPTSLLEAWPALLALTLTMLVEMVDNSVLNVAIPTIGRDLHATSTDLQWFIGAYSLTFGGLLLVGGTLGDKWGRRKTLLCGLALFGLTGLSVLAVHTPEQLIAVRALSGACAAAIAPLNISLIFRLFESSALRQRAIGIIITVSMIGFAIGPTLSGLAVEHFPWQALLVVNAPAALIAFIGIWWAIPADDPADRHPGAVDFLGGVLSVIALSSILYTFTAGSEYGWSSRTTLISAGLGIIALCAFILREKTAASPMLELSLISRPTVRGSALARTAVMVAMVGVMFASTQLFQFAWGWPAWLAGLANLPFVIGMLGSQPLVERIVGRWGHKKASIGAIVCVVTGLSLWIIALHHGYWWAAAGTLIITLGIRIIMTTCAVALIEGLPENRTSLGSALNDTAQELGNSLGVAIVGTVIAVIVGNHLPQGAWDALTISHFLHAQALAFVIMAGVVVIIGGIGVSSLSNSTSTDDH